MSALRKPQAPDAPNAGHRWDYTRKLFSSGIELSSDAKLLMYALMSHDGPERLINPGIRYLSQFTSLSPGRCMAARDELVKAGLITCVIGTGTRPTAYRLVDFDAWFAARSVPVSPPSVPDSPPSVHTVGTKPLEPQESEKKVVLTIVREGWPSLVHLAPEFQRTHWLGKVTEDGRDDDGVILLTAPDTFVRDRVKTMLTEDPAIAALCAKLGIDPAKVKIRAAKPPGAGLPPVRGAREGDSDGYDQRRSMGRQLRENLDRNIPDRLEAASDKIVLPLVPRPPGNNVTDLSAYRTRTRRQDDEEMP